ARARGDDARRPETAVDLWVDQEILVHLQRVGERRASPAGQVVVERVALPLEDALLVGTDVVLPGGLIRILRAESGENCGGRGVCARVVFADHSAERSCIHAQAAGQVRVLFDLEKAVDGVGGNAECTDEISGEGRINFKERYGGARK